MSWIESVVRVLRRSADTDPPPPEEFETCRSLWAVLPVDLKDEDEVRLFRERRPAPRWVPYLAAAALLILTASIVLMLASLFPDGGRPIAAKPTRSAPEAPAPVPPIVAAAGFPTPFPQFDEVSVAFTRGDSDADGEVGVKDALSICYYLFESSLASGLDNASTAGDVGRCLDAADANDDGRVDVSDGIAILASLFHGTGPLPEPYHACGCDETDDALSCSFYAACR